MKFKIVDTLFVLSCLFLAFMGLMAPMTDKELRIPIAVFVAAVLVLRLAFLVTEDQRQNRWARERDRLDRLRLIQHLLRQAMTMASIERDIGASVAYIVSLDEIRLAFMDTFFKEVDAIDPTRIEMMSVLLMAEADIRVMRDAIEKFEVDHAYATPSPQWLTFLIDEVKRSTINGWPDEAVLEFLRVLKYLPEPEGSEEQSTDPGFTASPPEE
jgi:hypothetical protein